MMNRNSGRRIGRLQHLQQSVADILTTPIGSRAMRRDYGCLAFALLDQPDNAATQIRSIASGAAALMRWEPRLQAARLQPTRDPAKPGAVVYLVTGDMLDSYARKARPVRLAVTVGGGQ